MAKTYTIPYSTKTAYRNTYADDTYHLYPRTDLDGYYAGRSASYLYGVRCLFSGLANINETTVTGITVHVQRVTATGGTDITYSVEMSYSVLVSDASDVLQTGSTQYTTNRVKFTWPYNEQATGGEYVDFTLDTSLFANLRDYGFGMAGRASNRRYINVGDVYLTVTTSETDYVLSYDANGGSGAPSKQTVTGTTSATFTISSTKPTRTGYTFKGWAKTASDTSAAYQPGESITITANQTLYAVWQINTYTVTYNKGANGSGTNTTATKTYGTALTLKGAIFTRTGYTQTGWSVNEDGSTKDYALSGSYTTDAAITLYPYWQANTCTVTFDPEGGTVSPASMTVTYGQPYGTLPTPTRTTGKFSGWYWGDALITSETIVSTLEDHTLLANWGMTTNVYWKCADGFNAAYVFRKSADGGMDTCTINTI